MLQMFGRATQPERRDMFRRIKKWLKMHVSFNSYLKIAILLEPIEQRFDLLKYAFFTRSKEGRCLGGTAFPKAYRLTNNVVLKSCPYLVVLAVLLLVPTIAPQCIADPIVMSGDASAASGFMAAILAIAGIFLTLFYTNAPTVFSNKYPSSSGDIPALFVSLVSSDKDLGYCTSFVVVVSVSFIVCATQWFNWLAFAYVFALAMVLVGKLPSIFSLGTGRTDITAISAIPANRFLVLARAASFEKSFFDSDYLVFNFKRFASNNLAMLDRIMDFSLMAGDYAPAYAKAVNEVVLETLVRYCRASVLIDTKSLWHTERTTHKTWFMSSSHELNLAISTGTIPQPKSETDCLGYHKELRRISEKYGRYLVENRSIAEYSNYVALSTEILKSCLETGDVEWAREYSKALLTQCLEYGLSANANDKEDLRTKCYLLEQYAVLLMTIPLGVGKLCDSVASNAFHFSSFSSFSQEELQKQGFPLGKNDDIKVLCEKLKYEKDAFGTIETPAWWFDENVNSFGLEGVERLCSFVLLLHDRYCSTVKDLATSDPKSSYILALKEAELYNKCEHCMYQLSFLAKKVFKAEALGRNYLAELKTAHDSLVRIYPDLAKSFLGDNAEFKDFFPDLYGFVCFNFCNLLFEDIVNNRLASFCSSIEALYHLVVIASLDLQKSLSEGSYNDMYKAQALSEPTAFFCELCGMAYAMAELHEDRTSQSVLVNYACSILESNPKERTRWAACLDICDDFALNGKIDTDLFHWRRSFINTVESSGLYPDIPRFSLDLSDEDLPADKERLRDMLPMSDFGPNDSSGCKIFEKYLLKVVNHD